MFCRSRVGAWKESLCGNQMPLISYMPTPPDYRGVSLIQTQSLALRYGWPKLPDQRKFGSVDISTFSRKIACRGPNQKWNFSEGAALANSVGRGASLKKKSPDLRWPLCNLVVQEEAFLKRFVKGHISHIHCIYQNILPYNLHINFHATLLATLSHMVQNHWIVILQ